MFMPLLFSNIASAQCLIRGLLCDDSKRPIAYAGITLLKDSSIVTSTISDSTGHYTIANLDPGHYKLIISNINTYDSIIPLHLTGDTTANIKLALRSDLLKTVTVYGYKTFERKSDRFVYTPDKRIMEGNDAAELMRHIPFVKQDEKNNTFSIIGKSGTVVYINNKKTAIPREMLIELLKATPAGNIKSVELITNPGSEYPANTSGGIININMKHQLNEGWLGTVSLLTQQGSYNKSILSGLIDYRKNKISLQLIPFFNRDFNYYTADQHFAYADKTNNDLQTRNFRRYWVFGNGLKVDYDINKSSSLSYNGWFSGVTGKSNTQTSTLFSKYDQSRPDSVQKLNNTGSDTYIYNFGNINYHLKIDSAGQNYLDANVDYNHFFQRQKNEWSTNNTDSLQNDLHQYQSDLPQAFFNISGRLEYGRKIANQFFLTTGIQISSTTISNNQHYYIQRHPNGYQPDSLRSVYYKYNEWYYAVFASVSRRFNEKWDGKIGMRAEVTKYRTQEKNIGISVDSSYINFFPNAALSYSLNSTNQFALSYSRKINRPTVELLYPGRTYISQHYFSQNNPYLQPSLANILEFTYTLKSDYVLSLTYTNNTNANASFIVPVSDNGEYSFKKTYLNYGVANELKLIINLHQSLFKGVWEIYLTPSYSYSSYLGKAPAVPLNITNHSLDFILDNYVYISKRTKWAAFVTFNYNGPVSAISGKRLNSISSLDIQIRKTIHDFSFNLIFTDIYNGSSVLNDNLYTNNLLSANRYSINNYNRAVTFKVRYNFGNTKLQKVKTRETANEEIRKRLN
ncbi:TonB-dependent receptor [Chitinophaga polysaccharea]|uniref:outer membrane beta-barrel family protein n=1 Tax=Chitinophaga polysaccharea TaxID=1293035 RepID=UPI0014551C40|nr:outer membrane beta-barrel family protein [Chitinophaga polysaccharea]NLR62479.1 TonB-dependent receptor [Chitinophaga polysaccharea]